MKKSHAQAITYFGVFLVVLGFYLIYEIFMYTYSVNSQPNPPATVMVYSNFPICNCSVSNGLAWNLVAAAISAGAVIMVVGYAKFRLVTHA